MKQKLSYCLLGIYFFGLACFVKKFAYINVNLAGISIYINEIVLTLMLYLRRREILSALSEVPIFLIVAWILFCLWASALFLYGLFTVSERCPDVYGLLPFHGKCGKMDVMQQFCIIYQSLWIWVAASFDKKKLLKLLAISICGAAVAQGLGILAFYFFGEYTNSSASMIGLPNGNEIVNSLYLIGVGLLGWPLGALTSMAFGHMWIVQVLFYCKRSWVIGILFFALPVFLIATKGNRKRYFLTLLGGTFLGLLLSFYVQRIVKNRAKPPYQIEAFTTKKYLDMTDPVEHQLLELVLSVVPNAVPIPSTSDAKSVIFHGEAQGSSMFAFRAFLWKQAWAGFLEHPIFGQGFGPHVVTRQLNGDSAVVDGKWISGPHNSFLTILFRVGLVGGFLFLTMLLSTFYYFFTEIKYDLFSWAAMSCFLFANFFALFNVCLESPQMAIWYWWFMGMCLVSSIDRRQLN